MGDYKKNPEKPFEIRVPNKIRTRIAMHEKESGPKLSLAPSKCSTIAKALAVHKKETKPKRKRGSLWSRFAGGIAKMFQIKPTGVRE